MSGWINVPDMDREKLLRETLFSDFAITNAGIYGETENSIHQFPVDLAGGEQIYVMVDDGKLRLKLTKAAPSERLHSTGMIDYKQLLIKYIVHVANCEGVHFIEDHYGHKHISDAEWEELMSLAEQLPLRRLPS